MSKTSVQSVQILSNLEIMRTSIPTGRSPVCVRRIKANCSSLGIHSHKQNEGQLHNTGLVKADADCLSLGIRKQQSKRVLRHSAELMKSERTTATPISGVHPGPSNPG